MISRKCVISGLLPLHSLQTTIKALILSSYFIENFSSDLISSDNIMLYNSDLSILQVRYNC